MAEFIHATQASPRVNLVWKATPTTTLYGGYARYFVPPPFELVSPSAISTFIGTTAAPAVTLNNPVKVERSNYFDVGVSQIVIPGLTIGVDGYYKISNNLVDEGQFGAPIILTAFNYAHGRQEGVELTASYDRGPWSIYGNLAWSRALGNDIVSAQFNFGPDELAFIANNFIHLDHDQTWDGSAGVAYRLNRQTRRARCSAKISRICRCPARGLKSPKSWRCQECRPIQSEMERAAGAAPSSSGVSDPRATGGHG